MASTMVRLPKFESRLYFTLWFSIFTFVMYKIYEAEKTMKLRMPSEHFKRTLFGREKDISDYEWSSWSSYAVMILPWLALHIIAAETTRRFDPEAVPLTHFLTTVSFILFHFPIIVPLVYIVLFVIFFLILRFGGVKTVWLFGISSIIVNQLFSGSFYRYLNYELSSVVYVSLGWFHLRCISFVLSELRSGESISKKFILFLGYAFYLPPFFFGPLFPYDLFKQKVLRPYQSLTYERLKFFCKDLFKIIALFFILEILFHFLYCNAMHYSADDLQRESLWALDGVCLCMAKIFYLKYLVFFGLPIAIMKFELYDPFPLPMCIFRIYLYSDMWRYFDRGFYLFMHNYIYLPLRGEGRGGLLRRLFSSFVCFLFVFVWHGVGKSVFLWSTLNFIGITCEAIGRKIAETEAHRKFASLMSPANQRRFNAIICSPFLILAIISNFIFFGGFNLGLIYIKQVFASDLILSLWLLSIGYLMCQASMEVNVIMKNKNKINIK